MSIKDRFAIAGLGITQFGKLPGMTAHAIAAEAVRRAIADAGLTRQQIDGYIYTGEGMGPEGQVPKFLGLPVKFIWAMNTGGVTAIASVAAACGALEAGLADYVVCVEAANPATGRVLVGASPSRVAQELNHVYGQFSPGADHAYAARRHMHEYGTTSRQLGAIAVAERWYANRRPEAVMHGRPLTIEDHQNSRFVAEPLHLLDYCLVTDGGVAVVVTTAERARALKKPPVSIMGIGMGHQLRQHYRNLSCVTEDVGPAKEAAFRSAGIELQDVDVAELYDCFTVTVLLSVEGYGWCKPGEGGPFFEAGSTLPGGAIPMNTGGGELSGWYREGYTPLAEAIMQMRGACGPTQVQDAEVALVSGHGGTGTGRPMQYAHGTLVLGRS